jgi:dinuclear metal center YbgI/SA1388 family protein
MALQVREIKKWLDSRFPPRWAESWDHIGLQVGNPEQRVERIGISLEATPSSVAWAVQNKLQLLICHHPLFFSPLFSLETGREPGRTVSHLIKAGLSLLVAHTNLDAAPDGVSTALANRLGLEHLRPLEHRLEQKVKVVVFIPSGYEENITEALKGLKAGRIGPYRLCTFKCRGEGTFLPDEDSHPFLGEVGRLQRASEWRLEILTNRDDLGELIKTVRRLHPYEEMAYDIYPLENPSDQVGLGRLGFYDPPMSWENLLQRLKHEVETPQIKVSGDIPLQVQKMAVCGGSAASLIPAVLSAGAEVLICGEIGYHPIVSHQGAGVTFIEIGHYHSEKWIIPYLAEMMKLAQSTEGWGIDILEYREPGDPYSQYF